MDAPDVIYLIEVGGETVWSEDPAPEPGMDEKDAVRYIRSGPGDYIKELEDSNPDNPFVDMGW